MVLNQEKNLFQTSVAVCSPSIIIIREQVDNGILAEHSLM